MQEVKNAIVIFHTRIPAYQNDDQFNWQQAPFHLQN